MKQSKRQQRLEAKKSIQVKMVPDYESMYPGIDNAIKNGIKPCVVINSWSDSDITIAKAKQVLKQYVSDKFPIHTNINNYPDGAMHELIELYEHNKFYYGFSKYQSDRNVNESELIEAWMACNFLQQEELVAKAGYDEQSILSHLYSVVLSYFLMGEKFAKIALTTFKLV